MKRIIVALFALSCFVHLEGSTIPALNFNDPLPMRSYYYPYEFLNTQPKARAAGDLTKEIPEVCSFAVSPYVNTSDWSVDPAGLRVMLGNVHGPFGLLSWTYGTVPIGQTENPILVEVGNHHFAATDLSEYKYSTTEYADPAKNFGFFDIPTHYKKMGARFIVSGRVADFVISAYGGVCDMRQSLTGLEDRTQSTTAPSLISPYTTDTVDADVDYMYQNLTRQWTTVFDQMGINYNDWQRIGLEDINLELIWRRNIPIQQEDEDTEWTRFIIVPHFRLTATGGFGDPQDPDVYLSLPFGNNGHSSFSASAGVAFAFNETIEVILEGGATGFTSQTQCIRVPTSSYQSSFYPYKTNVKISPAPIYHGSLALNAHYFIDRLSTFVQFEYANHSQNDYSLVVYDPSFDFTRLQADTEWKYGVLNVGLSYDLSPCVSLGGACQLPMMQRGTFQAHTFMIGIGANF